ncbi:dipeptidase [Simiduia agarivorans]|uniref:Peptidase M19 n=1 Tax=Simiduia agarivorans (strain DSM 21679 / JCM 13881 / BCRC 17597 / SA1) TaxID=1117647 RepID=K4KRL4_SIMAS|nr:dipeptidase [Simiduia agarivorans]AFV00789.1 peptidase M19 [Simiduia agarivorans SA1 = DSM 21679]
MKITFRILWGLAILLLAAIIVAVAIGPGMAERSMNKVTGQDLLSISPAAQALHDSLQVADWHADSLLWNRNLNERSDRGQVDIPRLQEGNVALQVFTVVTKTPAGLNYTHNSADSRDNVTLLALAQLWPMRTWQDLTERALYQSEKLHRFASDAPDSLMLVKNQADLTRLLTQRAAGKPLVGGMLGTEGSHALAGDLAQIQRLYDAGFRMMSLHHFFDNALGGSLHGSGKAGLTDFGRAAIAEMNRLGVIIDVSHSSPAVVREALSLSKTPLVVSHTGTHGHCASPRNIPDALMEDIARGGGLVAIGFWSGAICDASPRGIARALKAAVERLGEDAVALGSDFDGAVATSIHAGQMAQITQALLDEGVGADVIRKVMGGNQLRFLQAQLPPQ